ncbi:MAG: DUF2235 domain-containing protein [Pseudomonadota bacterium]
MKHIVILCDGTWNTADAQWPTHVVRLARALAPEDAEGHAQVPISVEGVGTGRGVGRVSRFLDRKLGGGLGWGLMANVVEAYRHLVFLYQPGDRIHIFGFSRGAFTARSLAGFIYQTGILDRDRLDLLQEAVDRYMKGVDIGSDESRDFRTRVSRHMATTPEELEYRIDEGFTDVSLLEIDFIGVWDTVGALGVPPAVPVLGMLGRGQFQFHNTVLSPMVKFARHAVALDERRSTFEPTLWRSEDGTMMQGDDDAPRQQRYFAGDHGTVGGSAKTQGLASYTLDWMMEGAREAGLQFKTDEWGYILDAKDPFATIHSTDPADRSGFSKLLHAFSKDRAGPEWLAELHRSVITRWWHGAEPYRPGSLNRVRAELAALPEEARGGETRIV